MRRSSVAAGRAKCPRQIPQRWSAAIAVVSLFASTTGCGTLHVRPPTRIDDPVRVYVVDYGRTSRLVLPEYATQRREADSSAGIEYAYGDWNWYALNNDSLIDAAAALLIPTLAALGRREVDAPGTSASGEVGTVYTFDVSRRASDRLKQRLDGIMDDDTREHVYNEQRDMHFVKLGESYWLPNQSSTEMKSWLQLLGCRVRGWTLIAEFEFEQ